MRLMRRDEARVLMLEGLIPREVDTAQNDVSTTEVNPFRALGKSPDHRCAGSAINCRLHMTSVYAPPDLSAMI